VLAKLLFWRQSTQRIFISYRRDDAQWAAGRLSDSLAAYFGDDRVFRDIEDIAGGANFGDVIHETLGAADAVVVLMGKDWLNAGDAEGNRRLDDPEDWVAQEIAAALAKGLPVYPVLLEDTPMPRASELPEMLWPLTRYNAVSISDSRWQSDVTRLAKIVALDIPSATERTLQAVNAAISTALFLAIAFTVSVIFWNLINARPELESYALSDWEPSHLFAKMGDTDTCKSPPMPWFVPLKIWQSGAIFVVVVVSSALMFVFGRHIDSSRKPPFYAAAWVGSVGSFAAFLLFLPLCEAYESTVISYMGLIVAPLMLALMGLSGFKAK
jgi:hypothetical protein